MKIIQQALLTFFASMLSACLFASEIDTKKTTSTNKQVAAHPCQSWQQQPLKALHSNRDVNLCQLTANKSVLVVNTASHCGFTKQFGGLETLHQRYSEQLTVIGFPSNDFNQEASDSRKIADVCYKNFGVSFTMTEPVNVTGENAHPLFKQLATQSKAPNWNFNKYLIGPDGRLVQHFSSRDTPNSEIVTSAIDQTLLAVQP